MTAVLEAVRSFAQTKWMSRKSIGRVQFEKLQSRALDHWLNKDVPQVDAYRNAGGVLTDLPIMNKSKMNNDFAKFNIHGACDTQVRAALENNYRVGNLIVGASTGTSGNRGLFVISDRERYRWLGSIIAKTMSDIMWRRQRVAIILPQGGSLYDSANKLRQINLQFFDLVDGPDSWRTRLEAFDPTVIVAPPKLLRYLVEQDFNLKPKRIFSAAETLDSIDQTIIEGGFHSPLRQIYMATEGLLGVSCAHGKLHLAEDSIFFEFEPVEGGLVNPIISSFRRNTQILARYRMNDLLRLSDRACPCGSPLQAVDEVVGRVDDCLSFKGQDSEVFLTPDVLRNAVLKADLRIADFRLIQTDPCKVQIIMEPNLPAAAVKAVQYSVAELLKRRGARVELKISRASLPLDTSRKLRRVENRSRLGASN